MQCLTNKTKIKSQHKCKLNVPMYIKLEFRGRQPVQTSEINLKFNVPGDRHPGEFRGLKEEICFMSKKRLSSKE